MGAGTSSNGLHKQTTNSRKIENELRIERLRAHRSQKILLLGAGESGKSTILKQMRIIHSNGFSEAERRSQKRFIHLNTIQAIASIMKVMVTLGIHYENQNRVLDQEIILALEDQENKLVDGGETYLTAEIGKAVKRLWSDSGIQHCYVRKNEYQLLDSAKFFLDNIDRISAHDYLPTEDDILRCTLKTTGIVEIQFKIKSMLFRVVDVGGQRSERRKWIRCFDDVNAIIFIASLTEYDQKLEEDETTNRMKESLKLFQWMCNHKLFTDTPMILFLNKEDLFIEKIATIPIKVTFPEYKGEQTLEEGRQFINELFCNQNNNEERQIYSHYTCATDTTQVSFVIESVTNTLVQEHLKAISL